MTISRGPIRTTCASAWARTWPSPWGCARRFRATGCAARTSSSSPSAGSRARWAPTNASSATPWKATPPSSPARTWWKPNGASSTPSSATPSRCTNTSLARGAPTKRSTSSRAGSGTSQYWRGEEKRVENDRDHGRFAHRLQCVHDIAWYAHLSGMDVDLAVERLAPGVVAFGFEDVEEEVAERAEGAGGVGEAHAVLAAGVAFPGTCINEGEALPTAGGGVGLRVGGGIEVRGCAVAGVHVIELRRAGVGMPRVGVDLGDVDGRAEVDAEAAAPGVGLEEQVRARLVFDRWQDAVGERAELAAIAVEGAGDERHFRVRRRVVLRR